MNAILQYLSDRIQEDFGRPVRLQRLIQRSPEIVFPFTEPPRSIARSSVVPWHTWSENLRGSWPRPKPGTLVIWRGRQGRYGAERMHVQSLADIGASKVIEDWQCEIQEVVGLGASKSNLTDFISLDEMVERNSQEMIINISEEGLHRNLSHDEIRIIHRKETSDCFIKYLWDGRLFLSNSGGSHHFAAARYIASRIRQSVPLRGKLQLHFEVPSVFRLPAGVLYAASLS